MIAILNIINVVLLGLCCGMFSYLLDYCFWPGSIFKNYLPWLSSVLMSKSDKAEVMMLAPELRDNEFVHRGDKMMLYKLLGGCIFCFNVWITFISFAFMGFEWYYIFVYTPVSHFLLRKVVD